MDSPSPTDMPSPEVYMSKDELVEELELQRVILSSIDQSVADRQEAEAIVKTEISRLEQRLHDIRQKEREAREIAAKTSISRSFQSSHSNPSGRLPSAQGNIATTRNPLQPLSFGEPSISYSSLSSTSTPGSTASVATTASRRLPHYSQIYKSLPSRKRSHHEHLDGMSEPYTNKSKRTTPSPGYGTPAATSSSEDEIESLRTKNFMRQQAAEARLAQEKADSELACKLQQQFGNQPSAPSSSNTNGHPSAFDRMLGVHNSSSNRSIGSSQTPRGSQSSQHDSSAGPSSSAQPVSRVKPEQQSYRDPLPGTFPVDSDDSDIEVISPSDFTDNGRARNPPQHMPPSSSEYAPGFSQYFQPSLPTTEAARLAAVRHRFDVSNPNTMSDPSFQQRRVFGQNYTLPAPAAMNMNRGFGGSRDYNTPGRPGYLYNGALPGSFPNASPGFSNYLGHAGPSVGSLFNRDPLSLIISRSSTYNYDTMTDSLGNPLDSRAMEIHDYINDPRKTAEEIKDLLENIRPDVEIPKEDREGTPDGLKYPLYEHQKLSLTWLKAMEEGTNKGGILADDMGLGKTISALALMLSRPSDDRARKTTLIIGPVALIRQWEREIRTKIANSHRQSTFIYHSGKKTSWDNLRTYDVVLTTYGTIGAEFKRRIIWQKKVDENPDMDRSDEKKLFPFLGEASKWYRIILDEAQCIKNKNTKAAQATYGLKALTRFCLTGTPMMNGVHELASLIHFLRIRPYNSFTRFNQDFNTLTKSVGSSKRTTDTAMRKLQAVLKAIMLRRTKKSKIDGKPILTLPEKTEEIVHVLFNEDEQAYYTSLESKTKLQFNKYLKAGTVGKNYQNILVLLLRLRQAACHPHLIMDFEEAPPDATVEELDALAKTLEPDVIARILTATIPFECPVCYDAVPNPRFLIPCGHDTCSECLVKITATAEQQGIAAGDESAGAKCPSCRGKIDSKKIIDYETFKRVHMGGIAEAAADDEGSNEESDSGEDVDSESDSDSETASDDELLLRRGKRLNRNGDLRNFVVPDGKDDDDEEEAADDDETASEDDEDEDSGYKHKGSIVKKENGVVKADSIKRSRSGSIMEECQAKREVKDENDDEDLPDIRYIFEDHKSAKRKEVEVNPEIKPNLHSVATKSMKSKSKKPQRRTSKGNKKGKDKGKDKGKANKEMDEKVKHTSLAKLKKEAMRSAEGRRRYMRYLRKNWVSSAKTDKCMDILRATDPSIKTIIFSQFTTLLDLVEVPISREKWRYERYDGSMSADARHAAVVNFTDDPNSRVMLVSLKAGNAGLNLVAASQVIILDPFWNPYIEMQAVDRAHRIGQQKPVTVHRILVQGTVEDRIMDLQERKRRLVEAALNEKASQGLGRLNQQDLMFLFNGGGERVTAARPNVYASSPPSSPLGFEPGRVYPLDSSSPM